MSSATKKTKAAKSTTRKETARTTAAEKKTAKKAASKPSAAKTARPKTTKTKTAKPKTTKAATAKPKTTKAATAKPKTTKAKTAMKSEAPSAAAVANAPTPVPETQPKREAPRKRTRSRRNRTTQVHAPAAEVLPQRTPGVPPPSSRLGTKWECFSCGAKFYDLNKPEPLCPKCEANQLERPKVAREVKPRVVPRTSRAMAPLLDEDEDAMVAKKEELDLGVADIDEAVTKFIDADEPDDEVVEEEEEEEL
jgi:hypothetical protein